jgi:L-ascorbate metabolism protein UlaG (beta-lactamase superfamily)
MPRFIVRLRRGGPWDWSLGLREQAGFDEHGRFMDGLVDAGFILIGGPLEGERDTFHVVEATHEDEIRCRFAEDPWAANGMLTPLSIERWTLLLDGLGLTSGQRPLQAGQLGLTWLGQGGFVLRFPRARILVDAFLSHHPERRIPAPFKPEEAAGFDVIACTHDHLDHLDREALPGLAEASPRARVIVPASCVEMVAGLGVPRDRITGIGPDEDVELTGGSIHAIPSRHGAHVRDGYSFGDGAFLGYVFSSDGAAVYHAGDTVDYEGLSARIRAARADVALLPINGRDEEREARDIVGNLDAEEAARVAADAGVKLAIPMHWDMFPGNLGFPERMVEAAREHHPELSIAVLAHMVELVVSAR